VVKARSYLAALIVAAVALALASPASAPAAFPGANGKILISTTVVSAGVSNTDIYAVDPVTGTDTRLTTDPGADRTPAASPDGLKIVFSREEALYVMNADGTGETLLAASPPGGVDPAWSPDGTEIVFARQDYDAGDFGTKLYVIDADGGNLHRITTSASLRWDFAPDWSPDGSSILFTSNINQVWKVNPDGSGMARILNDGRYPSWSPDGSKILYTAAGDPDSDLFVANPDGTDATNVTPERTGDNGQGVFSPDGHRIAFGAGPGCCSLWTMDADGSNGAPLAPRTYSRLDWQPIPVDAYPRPKVATPVRTSLVPAYEECTSPDRTHGPPLVAGSCSAPVQSSTQLTVGTPDANREPANSVGSIRYKVVGGDPGTPDEADVGLAVRVTDVRAAAGLSDYTGELRALVGLRITDKDNTPSPGGPGAATVADTVLGVTVPCAETSADSTIGSECSIATSADALVPDTVKEGRRSVWQLGEVRVSDGGADADADTAGDNTQFLTQGVFVP
jgi:hypothetical protein